MSLHGLLVFTGCEVASAAAEDVLKKAAGFPEGLLRQGTKVIQGGYPGYPRYFLGFLDGFCFFCFG